MSTRHLVLSAPQPRSLDAIFSAAQKARLFATYEVQELEPDAVAVLPPETLARVRYVLGQPPLSPDTLAAMSSLRAVLNVENNLFNNMPYETLFQRGIHVLTTGAVFAEPVAEMGLGLALDLARGITEADIAFREGRELWGIAGNRSSRLISGGEIGIIGFGDLGKALNRLLAGFRATIRVYDPWLPQSIIREQGATPADLDTLLSASDFIFVVAGVTSENKGFLDAAAFASMRQGAIFVLLSRADVVDFPALLAAADSGHILAASDVFPQEPLAPDHPARTARGFIRSAHRAGALDVALKRMGDMVLEDMDLLDRGLPPMRLKRAERETAARMRSRPVSRT